MGCWQRSGWDYHGSLLSHWGELRKVAGLDYSCTKKVVQSRESVITGLDWTGLDWTGLDWTGI